MAEAILGGIKRASGWSIALGVLMMILGIIAMLAPWEFGIVIALIIGWMAIFNGVSQVIYGIRTHSGGRSVLEVILGLVYVVAGIYLLMHPDAWAARDHYIPCFITDRVRDLRARARV